MTPNTSQPTPVQKGIEQVLIVYKKSQFELYENSRDAKTRAYLHNNPIAARELKESHDENYAAIRAVEAAFAKRKDTYITQTIYRGDVNAQMLHSANKIVSVGGDGTALDIGHLCGSVPILGVNSDPKRSVGFFCTANANTIEDVVAKLEITPITSLATIQPYIDGKPTPERAINDLLFAHKNVAGMTKYEITAPYIQTRKDSGLLVCTPAGSTAWMYNLGGHIMPLDDNHVQFRSRDMRDAKSEFTEAIELVSRIRDAIITIDTQHIQYEINIGQRLTLKPAEPLRIIGDLVAKQKEMIDNIRKSENVQS